jgi:hypothetical protein
MPVIGYKENKDDDDDDDKCQTAEHLVTSKLERL